MGIRFGVSIAGLFLALSFVSPAVAQEKLAKASGVEHRLLELCTRDDVREKLGLTASQIEALEKAHQASVGLLMQGTKRVLFDKSIGREDKDTEIKKVMEEVNSTSVAILDEVLTPMQRSEVSQIFFMSLLITESLEQFVSNRDVQVFLGLEGDQLLTVKQTAIKLDREFYNERRARRVEQLKSVLSELRPEQAKKFDDILKDY